MLSDWSWYSEGLRTIAELCRGAPNEFFEMSGEMALVVNTDTTRDLRDWQPSRDEQNLGQFDSALRDVAVR